MYGPQVKACSHMRLRFSLTVGSIFKHIKIALTPRLWVMLSYTKPVQGPKKVRVHWSNTQTLQ